MLAKGGQSGLEMLEESDFGSSGERTEGIDMRIHVLSHPPYCRSHLSQEEHKTILL